MPQQQSAHRAPDPGFESHLQPKGQDSLEKWLILGLGQKVYELNLDQLASRARQQGKRKNPS